MKNQLQHISTLRQGHSWGEGVKDVHNAKNMGVATNLRQSNLAIFLAFHDTKKKRFANSGQLWQFVDRIFVCGE